MRLTTLTSSSHHWAGRRSRRRIPDEEAGSRPIDLAEGLGYTRHIQGSAVGVVERSPNHGSPGLEVAGRREGHNCFEAVEVEVREDASKTSEVVTRECLHRT